MFHACFFCHEEPTFSKEILGTSFCKDVQLSPMGLFKMGITSICFQTKFEQKNQFILCKNFFNQRTQANIANT